MTFSVVHCLCLAYRVSRSRISLPFITVDDAGTPLTLEEELTRDEFESLCAKLLERLKGPVEKSLKDAGLKVRDLDEVVLLVFQTESPLFCLLSELLRTDSWIAKACWGLNPDCSSPRSGERADWRQGAEPKRSLEADAAFKPMPCAIPPRSFVGLVTCLKQ